MSNPDSLNARESFDWDEVLKQLGWRNKESVNVGETIIDRHVAVQDLALHAITKHDKVTVWTYRQLQQLSNRVANVLRSLGIRKGDRIAGVLSRRAETVAIMIGTWKCGAIYVPIFPGFGQEAIGTRLRKCAAKAVFVHEEHRERIGRADASTVVFIKEGEGFPESGFVDFWDAVRRESDEFQAEHCRRNDTAIILYTSGSTGEPKGVEIAGNFVAAVRPYMQFGVDLRPTDIFWPTGDPGWGYGLVCYHVALSMGVQVVCYEGSPTPDASLRLLQEHRITNLATVPTLLRGIMALGAAEVASYELSLRCISSCGEPLNSEVINFFEKYSALYREITSVQARTACLLATAIL
ncbi:MAG: hypothetical protein NVSMB58_36600 [Terriglobales bacterium]